MVIKELENDLFYWLILNKNINNINDKLINVCPLVLD